MVRQTWPPHDPNDGSSVFGSLFSVLNCFNPIGGEFHTASRNIANAHRIVYKTISEMKPFRPVGIAHFVGYYKGLGILSGKAKGEERRVE